MYNAGFALLRILRSQVKDSNVPLADAGFNECLKVLHHTRPPLAARSFLHMPRFVFCHPSLKGGVILYVQPLPLPMNYCFAHGKLTVKVAFFRDSLPKE